MNFQWHFPIFVCSLAGWHGHQYIFSWHVTKKDVDKMLLALWYVFSKILVLTKWQHSNIKGHKNASEKPISFKNLQWNKYGIMLLSLSIKHFNLS